MPIPLVVTKRPESQLVTPHKPFIKPIEIQIATKSFLSTTIR